ncbi:MAG: two-component regulator propeller domain-containing protein, partial [Opitutaceae bacterium]
MPLLALDPARTPNGYSIKGWFIEHGLPSYKIRAVKQARDGYLWVATAQGIARFDGSRFTVFTGATNPELRGGGFFAVQEAPDGSLWFGGDNGLFRWRGGHFERFTTEHGLAHNYVRALAVARDGAIVVCTRNGYSFMRDGRISTPDGIWKQIAGVCRSYLELADGSVLVGTDVGLWKIAGGKLQQLSGTAELGGNTFTSLLETPDGSVWIGYSLGLRRLRPDGKQEDFGEVEGMATPRVYSLQLDRGGTLWIGTYGGGLYRLVSGRIERANYAEHFGINAIQHLHEDREGALWIAAATGLFRLKDNVSRPIASEQGLTQTSVFAVFEASDRTWWFG